MSTIILFDCSTIAIVAPSLLLWGLIAVSVSKKRLGPWQPAGAFPVESKKRSQQIDSDSNLLPAGGSSIRGMNLVRAELSVYLLCLVFATFVLSWCLSHLSFLVVLRPDQNWIMNGLIPRVINLLITLAFSLPLLWFGQMRVLRAATGRTLRNTLLSSQFIFTASLSTALLVVCLPLVQWLLIKCGVSGESYFFMRDSFRVACALSCIPSSIAGLAVALHGESFPTMKFRRASKFLNNDDLSTLGDRTDDELHYLIEVALKSSKIDVADKISQHLLRRAESY